MTIRCPKCQATSIKKNGSIHNGKQKYKCLTCHRQFVENPENKTIDGETKERVRRTLLERVSLEGICRIFDISMPWLLQFMQEAYSSLPEDLNARFVSENEEFLVVVAEVDEMWSYVRNKKNQQWLWLVMDSKTRQILAFHVGDRSKSSGEALMKKLPSDLKKKPSFTQINFQFTTKSSPGCGIDLLERNLEKQATLKDLTVRLDRGVRG